MRTIDCRLVMWLGVGVASVPPPGGGSASEQAAATRASHALLWPLLSQCAPHAPCLGGCVGKKRERERGACPVVQCDGVPPRAQEQVVAGCECLLVTRCGWWRERKGGCEVCVPVGNRVVGGEKGKVVVRVAGGEKGKVVVRCECPLVTRCGWWRERKDGCEGGWWRERKGGREVERGDDASCRARTSRAYSRGLLDVVLSLLGCLREENFSVIHNKGLRTFVFFYTIFLHVFTLNVLYSSSGTAIECTTDGTKNNMTYAQIFTKAEFVVNLWGMT
eukprot:1185547-Prorocentrum_minimum.AAC.4